MAIQTEVTLQPDYACFLRVMGGGGIPHCRNYNKSVIIKNVSEDISVFPAWSNEGILGRTPSQDLRRPCGALYSSFCIFLG